MKAHSRNLLLILLDLVTINFAMGLTLVMLTNDINTIHSYVSLYSIPSFLITMGFVISFCFFKLYHRVWAYASIGELVGITQAVLVGSIGTLTIVLIAPQELPLGIVPVHFAFTILLIGGSRLVWRIILERKKQNASQNTAELGRRALIIGAGDAGAMVARELKSHGGNVLPVAFIDDDSQKQKTSILGLPVLGTREHIRTIVAKHLIDLIIIAMPSVGSTVIRALIKECQKTTAELKILPGMYEIIEGKVSVNQLRPVKLEDLLRREPVQVDFEIASQYLKGETILVTGAGGSIGSELSRQVMAAGPEKLILMGHGENSIHKIWLELSERFGHARLVLEIADIRDKQRVNQLFKKHRPGVVFHAAAHKHVPLMELNPYEAVSTNVFGTYNVADAASIISTKKFVMVSTDKAVNPSTVMGATKKIAELVVQHVDRISDTVFTAVRFGNVLGSNGSVVPVFERQIKKGGPVTVTHPGMERYFMTIPEAVQLVVRAGSLAEGGEIFVLDMGEPVRIVDLARDMIRLSGLEPDLDIKIIYTGVRPGEKLTEELMTVEELAAATIHKRIFKSRQSLVEIKALETLLFALRSKGLQCTSEDVFTLLSEVIPQLQWRREVG